MLMKLCSLAHRLLCSPVSNQYQSVPRELGTPAPEHCHIMVLSVLHATDSRQEENKASGFHEQNRHPNPKPYKMREDEASTRESALTFLPVLALLKRYWARIPCLPFVS